MKTIQKRFFSMASEGDTASQRVLIFQGALAAIMYSLGTGNFFAGYLSMLEAAPAQIAQITLIPQLGCILQLFGPLFFERKPRRKPSVIAFLFLYRFGIGAMGLAPLLFKGNQPRLSYSFVLYSVSFLSAGFVTPALNQWIMQIAPCKNRGRYFAVKDICAAVATAVSASLFGRYVDASIAAGSPERGYLAVYGFCIIGSIIDMLLLTAQREQPVPICTHLQLRDLLLPLKDRHFRPILIYEILGTCSFMISSGFLAIYQLSGLHLTHTFITMWTMIASLFSMGAIYLWGYVSDRSYWTNTILITRSMAVLCQLGWCFLTPETATVGAPFIIVLNATGLGATGMAGVNLQYAHSPSQGKTIYLGVTMAIGSAVGYGAAFICSYIQSKLQPFVGLQSSIAIFFAASALLSLCALLYGIRRLPRQDLS